MVHFFICVSEYVEGQAGFVSKPGHVHIKLYPECLSFCRMYFLAGERSGQNERLFYWIISGYYYV
jgi:hypothetical protein